MTGALNQFTNFHGLTNNALNPFGTNQGLSGMTNRSTLQDRAATAADQRLLGQIRQAIRPMAGVGGPWAPVQLVVDRGTVILGGYVPDAQQKQQLLTLVRRTPGVVRVVDQLQVAAMGNSAAWTNGFGVRTNLAPTGRTNDARVYPQSDLPPGLQNRELLPPGLRQRDQPPPGLDRGGQ